MESSNTLKGLQTQLSTLETKINSLKFKKNGIVDEIQLLNEQLNKVKSLISKLKKQSENPIISEHAMLRFLERVEGIDLKAIEEKILTERIKEQIRTLGDGTFPSSDNTFKLKVKDKVIVTIIN